MKSLCLAIVGFSLLSFIGCTSQTCIVANSTTGLGIVVDYNQQTQTPYGRLGYVNSNTAIVPTNRVADDQEHTANQGNGAKDTADVLMEFSLVNFFAFWKSQHLYQRMAIGEACKQPGAVAMLAKNADGSINTEAVKALMSVKEQSQQTLNLKSELVKIYKENDVNKTIILEQLSKYDIKSWDDFIDGKPRDLSNSEIESIIKVVTIK